MMAKEKHRDISLEDVDGICSAFEISFKDYVRERNNSYCDSFGEGKSNQNVVSEKRRQVRELTDLLRKDNENSPILKDQEIESLLMELLRELDGNHSESATKLREQITKLYDVLYLSEFKSKQVKSNASKSKKTLEKWDDYLTEHLFPLLGKENVLGKVFAFFGTLWIFLYNYLRYCYDVGYYSDFLGVPKALVETPDLSAFSSNAVQSVVYLILVSFCFVTFVLLINWLDRKLPKWISNIILIIFSLFFAYFLLSFWKYGIPVAEFKTCIGENKQLFIYATEGTVRISGFDWFFVLAMLYCVALVGATFVVNSNRHNVVSESNNKNNKFSKVFAHIHLYIVSFSVIISLLLFPHMAKNFGKIDTDRSLTFIIIQEDTLPLEITDLAESDSNLMANYAVLYTTSDHYIIAPCSISEDHAIMTVYKDNIASISKDNRVIETVTVDSVVTYSNRSPDL